MQDAWEAEKGRWRHETIREYDLKYEYTLSIKNAK